MGIIAGERPAADSTASRRWLPAHPQWVAGLSTGLPGLKRRIGMDRVATLLADAAADRAAGNSQLLLWGGVLVAALLLGAAILFRMDRWRRRMTGPDHADDSLSAFRVSYEEGEISADEFKRIRARLAGGQPKRPPENQPEAPTS